jgi:hypothetical protein
VYAIGNPGKITFDKESRYNQALIRSSGFGMITFDQIKRTILIDAWRFKADVENPNPVRDQFPGWPLEISQFDNLGLVADNVLPGISVNKPNQLLQIWNEKSAELVQIYRIKGNTVQPKLHESGTFIIIIGEGKAKEAITGLKTRKGKNPEKVLVEL